MISLVKITEKNFKLFQDDILEIEKASFPSPWDANGFWEEINNPVSHLRVLIEDVLAGYICFWVFAGKIHLMNIAVHPDRRCKGLGRYLLCRMIEAGTSLGGKSACLEVRPSNLAAKALYEKARFKESGRMPRYYRDTNEDAIVMSLSLGQKEKSIRNIWRKPVLQPAQ